VRLVLGNEAIVSYRRLSYKAWYAFAEFVDNSTQSFFDNRSALEAAFADEGREKLEVFVTYDGASKTIRIVDNAMGMDESEVEAALYIGRPPANSTGRSEYGMGLKTAASWFGNKWSITTKKLGAAHEVSVQVDVDAIAQGNAELPVTRVPKPKELHYTIIEITDLNHFLNGWAIRNTREFMASMFRQDLREGFLDLRFNDTRLENPFVPTDDSFLLRLDQTPYKVQVDTQVGGKPVKGFIGVMRPGVASRRLAGFSIVRRGRCIQGWLDSWRPEDIFGQGGRNDLINQRLTGELVVDEFTASHTKDAILWQNDEEEELIKQLRKMATEHELLYIARTHRGEDATVASATEREEAKAQAKEIFTNPAMVDAINIDDVPPPELELIKSEPLRESADATEPEIVIPLAGGLTVEIMFDESHVNDPYYTYWPTETGSLKVAINEAHPGYIDLDTMPAVFSYVKHCAFDAIAEWKCRAKLAEVKPESVRQIKDQLFRVSAAVESGLTEAS
jgi:hypothetical protein